VISLQAMRGRLPLLVFILLAVICLLMLGLACACASDHPAQKVDRVMSAISAAPALLEVWTFTFATLIASVSFGLHRRRRDDTTSPAALQCFLL
jgi:hypothetical protein